MNIRATLDEEGKSKLGWVLLVVGAALAVFGLIFFIGTNKDNLYAQKVTATILNKYVVNQKEGTTLEDKQRYILDLAYPVGDKMVFTSCKYTGVLDDMKVDFDIYYNIKDPENVMAVKWSFEPIVLLAVGLLIVCTGLYYTQIFMFGITPRKKPGPQSSEAKLKLYEAGEAIENNAIPMVGSFLFLLGGVIMKLLGSGWWTLSFMIVGGLGIFYFLLGLIPAITDYRKFKIAVKSKVVKKDDLLEKK